MHYLSKMSSNFVVVKKYDTEPPQPQKSPLFSSSVFLCYFSFFYFFDREFYVFLRCLLSTIWCEKRAWRKHKKKKNVRMMMMLLMMIVREMPGVGWNFCDFFSGDCLMWVQNTSTRFYKVDTIFVVVFRYFFSSCICCCLSFVYFLVIWWYYSLGFLYIHSLALSLKYFVLTLLYMAPVSLFLWFHCFVVVFTLVFSFYFKDNIIVGWWVVVSLNFGLIKKQV